MNRRFGAICWIVGGLLALLPGCSDRGISHGEVSGKVTLRGQPMTVGSIHFHQVNGTLVRVANLEPDGSYVVRAYDSLGLPVGAYRVAVSPLPTSQTDDEVPIGTPLDSAPYQAASSIPEKYLSPETSGIQLNVVEGKNQLNVELLE